MDLALGAKFATSASLLVFDPAPSAFGASLGGGSVVAADAASSSADAPEGVVGHCERLSEALLHTSRG